MQHTGSPFVASIPEGVPHFFEAGLVISVLGIMEAKGCIEEMTGLV